MNLVATQAAFLLDVCKLIMFATSKGYVVTGGERYRTIEQQKIYFDRGLTLTMDSKHCERLADDLNFFVDGQLATVAQIKPMGDYWQSLNPCNRWGGNFKTKQGKPFVDALHFERNE